MTDPRTYRPAPGEIPTRPGVYRFTDAAGRVLYVGKAKNLRARLANYFAPLHTLNERIRLMVTSATGVEWTVVGSDIESLQLEYSWIKSYKPPFNVAFRDDKSYPYVVVTLGEEAPRAYLTRRSGIPGARYFGPYPKMWAIADTLRLLHTAFPIRTCKDSDYQRAMATGKPCLASQIGRCGGPCSQRVTIEEHRRIVDELVAFLAGNDRARLRELKAQMTDAAARQDYEAAARLRDQARALELALERTTVVLDQHTDADVFGLAVDELAASVEQFVVRGGRVRGARNWVVDIEIDGDPGTLVESILQSAYEDEPPPRLLLLPALPEDSESLAEVLRERRGGPVSLRVPQRGDKLALLKTANTNALGALARYKTKRAADLSARSRALAEIQEALGMDAAPLRIECFDVSHLGGSDVVASMVVFEDGVPRKSHYRKFAIAETTDDTDSLRQVLTRRLAYLREDRQRADNASAGATAGGAAADGGAPARGSGTRATFAYPPQLLIVDGGQPQVQAAAAALAESGVTGIVLCGIAKRLEEVWLPDSDFPVILPRQSEALYLLQRIRDEAHRFAITYQRQKRKGGIRTQLEALPGVGPARVRALLGHFGSVAQLKRADVAQMREVPGIGPEIAATVYARLHEGEAPGGAGPAADESPAAAAASSAPAGSAG